MKTFYLLDYLAFISLIVCWIGYLLYLKYNLTQANCSNIFTTIFQLRLHWMLNIVQDPSQQRIADAQMLGMLQRNISFYISVTIFVIAGLMAMLSSSNTMISILSQLPYQIDNAQSTVNIKILIILTIFIVAFFRLSWALRQSRYYAIALFALPSKPVDKDKQEYIADKLATLSALSGKSFHNAYYSYYFGLSALSWLIHPLLFIVINIVVVLIIYRREFKSRSFDALQDLNKIYHELR